MSSFKLALLAELVWFLFSGLFLRCDWCGGGIPVYFDLVLYMNIFFFYERMMFLFIFAVDRLIEMITMMLMFVIMY